MSAEAVRTALIDVFKGNTNATNGYRLQLQGTLVFTNSSSAVVGTGTVFRASVEQAGDIKKGDYIRATTSTKWYKVASVASATSLTLSEVFAEATETGVVGYVLHLSPGIVRNTDFVSELRGIKVYHLDESFDVNTLNYTRQHVEYKFIVSGFFFEPDDVEAETRKATYASLLRKAIEADIKAGVNSKLVKSGVAFKIDMGPTAFFFHPTVEGPAYLRLNVTALCREDVG